MTEMPGVANTWLDTVYSANTLPRVCEERAKAIWEFCGDDEATITTTAVEDGYVVGTWTYDLAADNSSQ